MRRATRAELMRALDDLEREIKFGPPVSEMELDALLDEVNAESDANLTACCVLLGLDYESTAERAGILEYDAGLARSKANRQTVIAAIRERHPGISEKLPGAFFNCAASILDMEITSGWTRAETIAALWKRMEGAS